MNVLLLSPAFPPTFAAFAPALRARGATVLAIGDLHHDLLARDLANALNDYIALPDLEDYDRVYRAVALLIHRHGRIDHLESFNEHWLPLEARLREDFNVAGARLPEIERRRSKAEMATTLALHRVDAPPTILVEDEHDARAFARVHGYPLLAKPDVGSGAEGVIKIESEEALERVAPSLAGCVLQTFVAGRVTTYDGLVDRSGKTLFAASFVYRVGILESQREMLDVELHTRRVLPPGLETIGEAILRAFDLRTSFFHIEIFDVGGHFSALEINFRPPGGDLLDVMNYSADVDLFALFAEVVTSTEPSAFTFARKYHASHVGRRARSYRFDVDELRRRFGPALVAMPLQPPSIGAAMGDPVFLLRHEDEAELAKLIELAFERP